MRKKVVINFIIIIVLLLNIFAIKVYAATINVQSIILNKTNVNLEIGQKDLLVAEIMPENATNKKVSWKSDNSNVVTVTANGEIKGIAKGIATITVTTLDRGYTAKATINVSGISNITFEKYLMFTDKNSLGADEKYILKISPETTIAEFKQNITTYNTYKIYDLSNKEVKEEDMILTGMRLKLGDNSEYVLTVLTDTNSDGKLTMADVSRFKANLVGLTNLDDAQNKAADINCDGKLTIVDLSQMKKVITGLIEI